MSGSGNEQDVAVAFAVEGLDQELIVSGFQGHEGLSSLFQVELDLACSSSRLDFAKVVGKPALLSLTRGSQKRMIHGICTFLEQRGSGRRLTGYHVVLRPRAWRLTRRSDCRIFQQKSAKDIVTTLLDAGGILHRFSSRNNADPPQRDYCVQYRESDWNYISRLLEDEGYFYFFEHAQDKHTLVIANYSQIHEPIVGDSMLCLRQALPGAASPEHLTEFSFNQQVISGKVTLQDFNFEMPSLDFKTEEQDALDTDLEVYDYPGLYEDPDIGEDLSQIRLEELSAQRRGGQGRSDCIRLESGRVMTLAGHDRADQNGKRFLVTQVRHQAKKQVDLDEGAVGEQCLYSNYFEHIPATAVFRPQRLTRRPRVAGAQTAMVVGPSGDEIYTDEHGRVKVQFHWDRLGRRNQDSSCWIRVSQYWAGEGFGALFIPRIGQEVVVDFLEGDPDRPIIVGRVYNARSVPPYSLPDDKTKSTIKSNSTVGGGGFNEIRFDDRKGSEEVFTHAERDQNEVVKANHQTRVGGSQTRTVGGHRSATVVKGNDTIKVQTGSREVTVKQKASLTTEAGNREVNVHGGSYILHSHDGDIDQRAAGSIVLKANSKGAAIWGYVEGTYIHGTGKGVTINGQDKGVSVNGTGGKGVSIKGKSGTIGLELDGQGTVGVKIRGTPTIDASATGEVTVSAPSITLKAGASTIKLSAAEIRINSPMVKVNCAS